MKNTIDYMILISFLPIESDCDIICLQEVYDDYQSFLLIEELRSKYPYSARQESGGLLQYHNGLLVLSRWPITSNFLQTYDSVSTLEYFFATKSNLVVTIDVPLLGKLCLINVHTTAGGTLLPEDPMTEDVRLSELHQIVEYCEEISSDRPEEKIIIVGDLNCGPEASKENFKFILNSSYRDTFAEFLDKVSTEPSVPVAVQNADKVFLTTHLGLKLDL